MRVVRGRPHVWVIDVTDEGFLALGEPGGPGAALWSATDRSRADTLADREASRRLLARRAALRIVLAAYVEADPRDVRVVTAPGGKPVSVPAADGRPAPPAFSVGHSGSLYCIGVSAGASVGCDVEKLRPVPRSLAIAERWFGRDEATWLSERAGELDVAFMELWTGKEALAKRHGAGLRLMMGQRAEAAVRDALDVDAERAAGRLRAFEPAVGYAGAVACAEPIDEVEIVRPGEDAWTI